MATSSSVKQPSPVDGRSFRLALVQLGGCTPSKATNLERAKKLVLEAAKGKNGDGSVDMIVLPECFNSLYGAEHFDTYAEPITGDSGEGGETTALLHKLAKDTKKWLIGGSIPERDNDGKLYNTSTIWNPDGKMIAKYRKMHLFDIDIPGGITFQESKTLTGGNELLTFDTDFGKLGLAICYDVRFPEVAMIAARSGCIAMIYPGAFNTTTGPPYWELLARARAVDNQIYVAMCSPARAPDGYPAWGHSMLVEPTGKVQAELDEKEGIAFGEIDVDLINKTRKGIPISVQRRFDCYTSVAKV
ncbi:putative nitrilase [Cystobasidium minutum MCA 4210]|uniref:putative nitrilase n=1 Tax=Cystobasidium minutum MCA 4210 TaxID=1397322 RepID=UPI0034CE36BC|eukprot:jgi/Rhomi1/145174/e_gw1.5.606.1